MKNNNYYKWSHLHVVILFCLLLSFNSYAQIIKGQDIDGEIAGDFSGYSVSLSDDGNTVAIGAVLNNGNAPTAGHVRVYIWNGTIWVQKGLDIDGEAISDQAGSSVSLSGDGNVIAIGARLNNGSGLEAGHVRIYNWNGSAWMQKGLDIDGEHPLDWSGCSVSLSDDGNAVAIGAKSNYPNGHVRVYKWTGTAWLQKGLDIDGEAADDFFGESVSLSDSGNTVAIGAPYNGGYGYKAGHVRVYKWNGTSWLQKGFDIDGKKTFGVLGTSVSLSDDGNAFAVGAPDNQYGPDAGHVRVYNWNGIAWIQKGIDIDGELAGDQFGLSVALTPDGNTVAIGAPSNHGNGLYAGHVRLYNWSGTAWLQKGVDIDGEASGDNSGFSVSLSGDGSIVAIGALYNNGNGIKAGHVRVYGFSTIEIADNVIEKNIHLYPNPNNGLFTMNITTKLILTVVNVFGETILTSNLTAGVVDIDITNQPAGIYFVNAQENKKQYIFKIVKY